MKIFFAMLLALSLPGCADLRWQKAAAGASETDADLVQCEQKAMLSSRRLGPIGPQYPTIVGSPGGPVTVIMPSYTGQSDPIAQQNVLWECMRGKGYSLIRQQP